MWSKGRAPGGPVGNSPFRSPIQGERSRGNHRGACLRIVIADGRSPPGPLRNGALWMIGQIGEKPLQVVVSDLKFSESVRLRTGPNADARRIVKAAMGRDREIREQNLRPDVTGDPAAVNVAACRAVARHVV